MIGKDVIVSDAADLHATSVVADTHNDLLMLATHRGPTDGAEYFGRHWLPQLRAGSVDLQVLPVFIDDQFRPEGALRQSLRMIEMAYRICSAYDDEVALCLDGNEVDAAIAAGKIAFVLALEGCPQLDNDASLLQTFARLGIRMVSFTHFGRSALGDGSREDATGGRLTTVGVEALSLLEELGVIVDLSHVGLATCDHIMELATRPVIASHSSARALRDHHRNLSDERLRQISAGGGVASVNFFPGYLSSGEATVDVLLDHIEHMVATAGADHVGLGPDFVYEVYTDLVAPCDRPVTVEGVSAESLIPGIEGPSGLPLVTAGLLARGMAPTDVRKVIGGNVHELFRRELGRPKT